jgi:hypothetical protein
MRLISLTLLALLCFALPSLAQTTAFTPPPGQGIVAKLTADLDATKLKPGDPIQAQVTHDLKNGHETLLKKGSTISGRVIKVEPPTSTEPSMIVILFDEISPVGGSTQPLNARVGALAPPPGMQTESLQDGRGMAQSNINAATNGDKDVSSGADLSAGSVGVHGYRGMMLASTTDAGKLYSIIKSSAGDIKLKKNTQIVLNTPE